MTNVSKQQEKWLGSDYAEQYLSRESLSLKLALRQISGPRVLQLGRVIDQSVVEEIDFPQLIQSDYLPAQDSSRINLQSSLIADPAFLPFQQNSISSVLMPHVLEGHTLPHQVLREVHRVLISDGHLVLTGFNRISLMGLQRLILRHTAFDGTFYTLKRVIDWLQLLGFEIVGSDMFQYSPLIKNSRLRNAFEFINAVGDRWLPMMGGGYMIIAKKRDAGTNFVGRLRFATNRRQQQAGSVPAKTAH